MMDRYIVASPTAKYNEPRSVFEAPADVVFLCSAPNELTKEDADAVVASGCKTVVDGGYRPVSSEAAEVHMCVGGCERLCNCELRGRLFGVTMSVVGYQTKW